MQEQKENKQKLEEMKDLEWDKMNADHQEQNFLIIQMNNDNDSNSVWYTKKRMMFEETSSDEKWTINCFEQQRKMKILSCLRVSFVQFK